MLCVYTAKTVLQAVMETQPKRNTRKVTLMMRTLVGRTLEHNIVERRRLAENAYAHLPQTPSGCSEYIYDSIISHTKHRARASQGTNV